MISLSETSYASPGREAYDNLESHLHMEAL